MTAIYTPEGCALRYITDIAGRKLTTVLHTQKVTPAVYTHADLVSVAAAASGAWINHLAQYLSKDISLVQTVAAATDSAVAPVAVNSSSAPGGVNSPALPIGVSACVTEYTATRGRSYRGRAFLPGLPQNAATADGLWVTGLGANLVTFFVELNTALQALTPASQICIESLRTGGAPRGAGILTPVDEFSFRAIIPRYQRRREQDHHGRKR